MPSIIRVPDDIYTCLRHVRISLEGQYEKDAPTFQDFALVALKRLLSEWEQPNQREQILLELLDSRKNARSRMGPPSKSAP